jgi:hypothetical protein
MGTIRDLKNNLPSMIVDVILKQCKDKLGEDFSCDADHQNKTVTITNLPEKYKEEINGLISTQGYSVIFAPTNI